MAVQLDEITLKKKGDSAEIKLTKCEGGISSIKVKLTWAQAVNLDIHAFYRTKRGECGHVYFGNKHEGTIFLDQDARRSRAEQNVENLTIAKLDEYKYILFATNIFRLFSFLHRGDLFSKYDAKVLVSTQVSTIQVPLNATEKGRWASIAMIDNLGEKAKVINVNHISKEQPVIEQIIGLV